MKEITITTELRNFPKLLFLLLFSVLVFNANADVSYSIPLEGKEFQLGNMLEWGTYIENDSRLFVIEKSSDGITYDHIGEVHAAGDSDSELKYRFIDVNARESILYYRLRLVDIDGAESTSDPVSIEKKLQNQFIIVAMSTVETNDVFDVSLDSFIEEELTYTLKDYKGNIIIQEKLLLINGLNEIMVNIENEKEGFYKLSLELNEEVETLIIRKVEGDKSKKRNVASSTPEEIGG